MKHFGFPPATRRREPRLGAALPVRWARSDGLGLGYTTNVSLRGFCLRTRGLEPVGTKKTFSLEVSPQVGDILVDGRVRWVRQIQGESEPVNWHEMGVQFEAGVPVELLELLKSPPPSARERRHWPRVSQSLNCVCHLEGRQVTALSFDVSGGGIRLEGDHLPSVGERLLVELLLPGNREPLRVRGEVLRRVSEPTAASRGQFVVRFYDYQEAALQQLLNYLSCLTKLESPSY